MSKQTAVRWLVSILNKEGFAPVLTNEEIQEALQMEHEQIEDAFKQGQFNGNMYEERGFDTISSNQFYKQIYGDKE